MSRPSNIVIDSSGPSSSRFTSYHAGVVKACSVSANAGPCYIFSYWHGLPETADQIFDMRFAKNPHWDDALRELTGQDGDVAAFLAQDETANMVLHQI